MLQVQDEFLQDPETQELERIVEEIVAPVTKKRNKKKLEAGLELGGHTCSTPDSQNTGTSRWETSGQDCFDVRQGNTLGMGSNHA